MWTFDLPLEELENYKPPQCLLRHTYSVYNAKGRDNNYVTVYEKTNHSALGFNVRY